MNPERTALSLALLCSWSLLAPTAMAQLINTDPVTGVVDDSLRHTQGALQPLTDPARRAALAAQAAAREAALDPVQRALSDPLAALPDALPILNAAGETVLQEVATEDGWRAVSGEWLLWLPEGELNRLSHPGITLLSATPMPALGQHLVRFRVSEALDQRASLQAILPAHLHPLLDRNHTYNSQTQASPADSMPQLTDTPGDQCLLPVRIGMVDTGVQVQHPAFKPGQITRKDFLPAQLEAPDAHGTAVAGVLIGQAESLSPRLPKGQLFAAAAFYQRGDFSQGATTNSLIEALNWLAGQQVSVINLSLAGPPNRLLGMTVQLIHQQGIGLVAAVGNNGPASPPLYPAAFDEVIGVTAVNDQHGVYRWANRGQQVDFAAFGVAVHTARAIRPQQPNATGRESGTSMASPVVAAHLACALAQGLTLQGAKAFLAAQAIDLGEQGRDPVFGDGWLP